MPKLVIDVRIYMQQMTSADDVFRDAGVGLNDIVGELESEINSCSKRFSCFSFHSYLLSCKVKQEDIAGR